MARSECFCLGCEAMGTYWIEIPVDGRWLVCVKHERRWRRNGRLGLAQTLPKEEVVRMHAAGYGARELARAYGVHRSSIGRILTAAGVTHRHAGQLTPLDQDAIHQIVRDRKARKATPCEPSSS